MLKAIGENSVAGAAIAVLTPTTTMGAMQTMLDVSSDLILLERGAKIDTNRFLTMSCECDGTKWD